MKGTKKLNKRFKLKGRTQKAGVDWLTELGLPRIEYEKYKIERKEAERKEAERKEAERKEAERKEAERKEAERKEAERKEAERKEIIKKQLEYWENKMEELSNIKYQNMGVREIPDEDIEMDSKTADMLNEIFIYLTEISPKINEISNKLEINKEKKQKLKGQGLEAIEKDNEILKSERKAYRISDEAAKLDLQIIHQVISHTLTESYLALYKNLVKAAYLSWLIVLKMLDSSNYITELVERDNTLEIIKESRENIRQLSIGGRTRKYKRKNKKNFRKKSKRN